MKYRRLDQFGDMQFGHGLADFYVDVPEAVAQAVLTRLRLWVGDWFLDNREGTDWPGSVLGVHSKLTADLELRARIGGTQGLAGVQSYASIRDGETRSLAVRVMINTEFGDIVLAAPVNVRAPIAPGPQLLGALLGIDAQELFGPDGQALIGPADPSILVYI